MKLRRVRGPQSIDEVEMNPGDSIVFGREPSGSAEDRLVSLLSGSVSRNHCKIYYKDNELKLEDLGSSNGTRVNRQKVAVASLQNQDFVQIGEFSFVVDSGDSKSSSLKTSKRVSDLATGRTSQTGNTHGAKPSSQESGRDLSVSRWRLVVQEQFQKFEKLDLSRRALILILVGGFLAHWVTTAPALSDARRLLLRQSFDSARKAARALGERNRRELADGSSFLLDCKSTQGFSGILESYLFDARGKAVCPVGAESLMDEINEIALYRSEQADNCEWRILYKGFEDCELAFPVREFQEKQAQYVTVGVARVRYSPVDAFEALQKLRTQSWRTLVLSLLLLFGVWWLWQRWLAKSLNSATENLHLVVTGNAQNLEKLENFAASHDLTDEINRLISKSFQALKSKTEGGAGEASFLQTLIQQVLLLEERAVMVVDKDNQLVAVSASLSGVIPVNADPLNVHITEAVTENHLQGELMTLLNDLSVSSEVIDRALSSSDRIVQVRGMPLFLNNDYAASILIF